jgi:hypothetical protein
MATMTIDANGSLAISPFKDPDMHTITGYLKFLFVARAALLVDG